MGSGLGFRAKAFKPRSKYPSEIRASFRFHAFGNFEPAEMQVFRLRPKAFLC